MARHIEQSRYYAARPVDTDIGYGAVVTGLDPATLGSADIARDLRALWAREGVLVFEGLEGGAETQVMLSGVFGRCIMHPAKESNSEAPRGLINVKYEPDDGWLIKVDGELRGQWLPWHSDLIYVDRINHGGILRPIQLPSRLGQTGFADKIGAYDLLPDRLRRRVEGLHVRYHYDLNQENQRFGRRSEVEVMRFSAVAEQIIARKHEFPVVLHPMVFAQEETGRKVLNVSPWFALGIKEMPGADGDDLLAEVMDYALDPRVTYVHEWRMDQMVLWDNWRVLHCAQGAPADEVRFLQRTTIDGDYGLGTVDGGQQARNPADYISV